MRSASCALTLLLTLTLTVGVAAAERVNKIMITALGKQPVSEQFVFANIRLRPGAEYVPQVIAEDIKHLLATGQFDDVRTKVEKIAEDQVNVTFEIKVRPKITAVGFIGNTRVSTARLMEKIKLKPGDPLNHEKLGQDLEALDKLYYDKGYRAVKIKQTLVPVAGSEDVQLVYDVNEGLRLKTRGVSFTGNQAVTARKLKKVLETKVSWWGYLFPTGFYDETEAKRDCDRIAKIYAEAGYLDAKVERYEKTTKKDQKAYVTFHLNEGQPYRVTKVTITGATVIPLKELEALAKLRVGETFSSKTEEDDAKRITDQYNHLGYLDSHVVARRDANLQDHTIAVEYAITEGRKITIRDIQITGNQVTKENVIRRELQLHPGDLGDRTKIEASRARLKNLGYFSQVDIVDVPTQQPDQKDLQVNVVEQNTGRLVLGAGISTVDDLVGTIEIAQTNFGLTNWPTFRGGGQRLRFVTELATSRQDFTISFTEPWLFDRQLRFDWALWKRSTSTRRDYTEDSIGTSVGVTRPLTTFPSWRGGVSYRIEEMRIYDVDDSFSPQFIDLEERQSLVSAVTFELSRDQRDSLVFPTAGSLVRTSAEVQSTGIGSYTDLYKLTARGDKYYPVFKTSVLRFSARGAVVDQMTGDEPRIFDRYFAGGMGSIRGFPERQVGPIDPRNEEPIGGKSLLLGTAEVMTPLYEDIIYWAFWGDAGNVWADSYEWDLGQLNTSAGVGIRFRLPQPSIAFTLDYGWPIQREWDHLGNRGRLHFSLGYGF